MSLFPGVLALTLGTTLATGAAALLWAQFVGRGLDDRGAAERGAQAGLDIRTW